MPLPAPWQPLPPEATGGLKRPLTAPVNDASPDRRHFATLGLAPLDIETPENSTGAPPSSLLQTPQAKTLLEPPPPPVTASSSTSTARIIEPLSPPLTCPGAACGRISPPLPRRDNLGVQLKDDASPHRRASSYVANSASRGSQAMHFDGTVTSDATVQDVIPPVKLDLGPGRWTRLRSQVHDEKVYVPKRTTTRQSSAPAEAQRRLSCPELPV